MDWNISRNYEKRVALLRQARNMEEQRKKEVALLLDDDSLSDEEWDKAHDEIIQRYNVLPLYAKMHALEYPQTRNEWFKKFVGSFGICESRRISMKQADIFFRYSERNHDREMGRGDSYFVNVGSLFVETRIFPECAYVTIKEV